MWQKDEEGNWCMEYNPQIYKLHSYKLEQLAPISDVTKLLEKGRMNDAFNTEDTIFMQFTGLLDKQGKEIFEGDILKFYPLLNDRKYIETVSFDNGCFLLNDHAFGLFDKTRKTMRIIGNIYENPELLKE